MSFSRGVTGFLALSMTALIGCGSPPPPAPTATKDIENARMALDSGRTNEKAEQIDAALASYRRAKEAIAKGKEVAEGTELTQLESMEKEAREHINNLEIKKINIASQPEKPKVVAVATTPKSEDPEEKKKREAEAADAKLKAKTEADKAKIAATFQAGATTKPKEKQSDDEDVKPVAAKKEGEAGGDKDGNEKDENAAAADNSKGRVIKPAKGPFPAVTEQSPEMEIVKLQVKGKYAIAYFQVYNKTENGRSIVGKSVYFKNANGQEIVPAQSVQVYPYFGFKADAADPSNQQIDGLTVGSHQITGGDAMQFAAVGTSDTVAQVKSVGVVMVFNDGTKLSAAGPAGGVDLNAGGGTGPIKGLKTK